MSDRPRLLLVDDEVSVRKTLELVLEDEFEIESIEDSETATAALMARDFDLLILDKNLPGKSGLELARLARERNPGVKVVMITGYASTASAVEALSLGLDAYLEKPFDDVYEVARRIQTVMAAPSRSGEGRSSVSELVVAMRDRVERARVQAVLQNEQRTVREAVSMEEVDALIGAHRVDLLILGAELADRDIIEVVKSLQDAAPAMRCVIAADQPPLAWITRFIELGVHGLLERPFDEAALRSLVGHALAEEEPAATEVA